jgi:Family of unknown function (DUF5719)
VRNILANRYLLALLVVIAVGAEFGLASVSHPAALASPRTPAPGRAAVTAAVRACPAPGSFGATAAGVALAAASAGTGEAAIARLSAVGSTATPTPLHVLTRPGQLALVNVPAAPALARGLTRGPNAASGSAVPTGPARGGVMISASGAMAQGFEAEQTAAGGMATAPCQAPGTDFWFVGPGQKSVANIQLYLMNTDSQAADATVQILTDSGPVLGSTDAGIGVPAHGLIVQSLAKLLRGSHVVALNVTTSVGQVAAAVLETSSGAQPGAWLPPAQPPATSQVLPGLPGAVGPRQLYIAVPGGDNAQVKVTAVTVRGSYQPTGGSGINLPGGSAVSVALPSLGGVAAAIQISSNVPVTASMAVSGGPAGAPGAFTAATPPVQEQGVVAGNPGGPGSASVLVLSAPLGAAQVRVSELPTAASPRPAAPRLVQLAAGHTVVVALPPPRAFGREFAFAVVITPLAGSGPVYAGRVTSAGGVVRSILPVSSALTWVQLPPVRSALTAALP